MLNINIDDFLNDIPGKQPEGESVRYSGAYDQIREAGREEPDLPQGVWQRDIKVADWKKTEALCIDILQNKSKDLQVAAWLAEAWLFRYGMQGFVLGLKLLYALTQKYWDNAYPKIEATDLDYRLSPFIWVNDKLSERVQFIPIMEAIETGGTLYRFSDWVEVNRLSHLYQRGDRKQNNNPLESTGDTNNPRKLDLDTGISKTSLQFYLDLKESIAEGIDTCKDLDTLLDEKVNSLNSNEEGVTFYQVLTVLNDILGLTNQLISLKGGVPVDAAEETPEQRATEKSPVGEGVESPATPLTLEEEKGVPMSNKEMPTPAKAADAQGAGNTSTTAINNYLQGRDQAYQQINEAADFLAKIEPHSPVPYLIKRAVSWRSKSFMDLMKEMVHDAGGMTDINRLLGLSTPQQPTPHQEEDE